METFFVVSMDSGELLLALSRDNLYDERNGDTDIQELQQSLKLYAIFCMMKQCSTDDDTNGECWVKDGASCTMFREGRYQRSSGGQEIPTVMILSADSEVDQSGVAACLDDLSTTCRDCAGEPSSLRERCRELFNARPVE